MLLTAKSALVTGAANRLGAQIARTLHQNGANLIIHYRASSTAAQSLVAELNQLRKNSAITLSAELSSVAELEELAAQACSAFDGLDILVNNASSFYPTKFGQIEEQAWDDLIASNYKAPLFLSQACYPALQHSSGCGSPRKRYCPGRHPVARRRRGSFSTTATGNYRTGAAKTMRYAAGNR